MSLLKCVECGSDVSEYAEKCQNCGCPIDVIKKSLTELERDNTKIVLHSGKILNIPDFKEIISEKDIFSKVAGLLVNNYGFETTDAWLILDIFKFNNYKFSDNYQQLYEDMTARNRREVQAIASTKVHCPYCKSTNVNKIGVSGRLLSTATLGIAGSKIGKQWHCNSCKSDF